MNFIVAVSEDFAIGKENRLLFSLPSDLAYFKKQTSGKVVVMGDRTFYSLPKHPLPNRTNIVMTFDENFNEEGTIAVHSLKELGKVLEKYDTNDVWVCGGASIYNLLMDYCDFGFVTKIKKTVDADTYINNVDKKSNWKLFQKGETQHENNLEFSFDIYQNMKVKKLNQECEKQN